MKIKILLDHYKQSRSEVVLAKVRVRKVNRDLRACHKKWRFEQVRWETLKVASQKVGESTTAIRADKLQAQINCTKFFPSEMHSLHLSLSRAIISKQSAKHAAERAKQAIRDIQNGVSADLFDNEGNRKSG